MWENIVERDRPQMAIWRMRIACWITKATDTHWEYQIHIVFLCQQRLRECASMVFYRYSTLPVSCCHLFYRYSTLPVSCCHLFYRYSTLPVLCCHLFYRYSTLPVLCCHLFYRYSTLTVSCCHLFYRYSTLHVLCCHLFWETKNGRKNSICLPWRCESSWHLLLCARHSGHCGQGDASIIVHSWQREGNKS
jgi:uncharacterized protein with PQ loop repeat